MQCNANSYSVDCNKTYTYGQLSFYQGGRRGKLEPINRCFKSNVYFFRSPPLLHSGLVGVCS